MLTRFVYKDKRVFVAVILTSLAILLWNSYVQKRFNETLRFMALKCDNDSATTKDSPGNAPLRLRSDTKSSVTPFVFENSALTETKTKPNFNPGSIDQDIFSTGKATAKERHETEVDLLTEVLARKLRSLSHQMEEEDGEKEQNAYGGRCSNSTVIGNSCSTTGCLQLQLPVYVRDRVEQLVTPEHFRIDGMYSEGLRVMRSAVRGFYELILVTGASSNHFEESMAMIRNVQTTILPHLKNFTFLYYDLGLLQSQRETVTKTCRCNVIIFPFHLFPNFTSNLKCYTWKPIIANAHIGQANILLWSDASIRFFSDFQKLRTLMDQAKIRGLQSGMANNLVPHTTMTRMIHFFGDEPCAYLPYRESTSGFWLFHNEYFVRRAILEPWMACAMDDKCMCPHRVVDPRAVRTSCDNRKGHYHYDVCHRFDQSAITMIVAKLFQDKYKYILLENRKEFFVVERERQAREILT